jgi:hypothetical protein
LDPFRVTVGADCRAIAGSRIVLIAKDTKDTTGWLFELSHVHFTTSHSPSPSRAGSLGRFLAIKGCEEEKLRRASYPRSLLLVRGAATPL